MIFRNFNIDVSCAANLVFWGTVLSEKLRIWLCLFFLLVKMAGRQHSRTSSVFSIILYNPKYLNSKFYKLGEWLYHLYEFHLNWFTCMWEPDSFILLLESEFFGENMVLRPTSSSVVTMAMIHLPIQIWLFLFIPPDNLPPHKKWRGVKYFHFQLCFTFLENCS